MIAAADPWAVMVALAIVGPVCATALAVVRPEDRGWALYLTALTAPTCQDCTEIRAAWDAAEGGRADARR